MTNLPAGRTFDLLPPTYGIKSDPRVRAFCYAVDRSEQRLIDRTYKTRIWSQLMSMPEDVIDFLAAELRTPFYDKVKILGKKREVVAATMEWYAHLGAYETVVDILRIIYGDAEIHEWYEYGRQPYTFRARVNYILDGWAEVEDFVMLLMWIKNTRSWLERLIMVQSWEKHLWHMEYGAGYALLDLKLEYIKDKYIKNLCHFEYSTGYVRFELKPETAKGQYATPLYCGETSAVYERLELR
ncbi:MAG: phage tail protein [Clostridiales bacterium]|jgi:P2-related tail formation protein|nr:phage tail protein [Clostridiales bacterium]